MCNPATAVGVPERHFRWDDMAATPAMLVDLIQKYGYRIGHIGDAGKHHSGGWDAPLPALREVSCWRRGSWTGLLAGRRAWPALPAAST